MDQYILSCCSTADLTAQHFEARNIHYVCFHYEMDGVSYPDDLGQSMPFDIFYDRMAKGATTKTSQVNVDEFEAHFEPFLKQGLDIIHVTLSSALSGVINSAELAKKSLLDKYPDRRIAIIDSLGASSGYGMFMDEMADLRDGGMSFDDLVTWATDHRLHLHHWFFSTDLSFYVRGGRISKTAGAVGSLLNICPLLWMNSEGKLMPKQKIRTKRKVIKEIVEQMKAHVDNGLDYAGKCFISHSACLEDAQAVARLVEQTFRKRSDPVQIYNVGTTIGSHTGPGTVALYFWGDLRTE